MPCMWSAYQSRDAWLKAKRANQARVIVNPCDYTQDFYLPKDTAKAAYEAGLLAFDATNETYTTKR